MLFILLSLLRLQNSLVGDMISMPDSSEVDCEFDIYNICICLFLPKQVSIKDLEQRLNSSMSG